MPRNFNKTPDFGDIENNKAAQDYLIERSKEVPPEDLFEEIYQNRIESGAHSVSLREQRRDHLKTMGKPDEKPYLDTKVKQQEAYEAVAKEDTAKAMTWLQRALNKSNSRREK